MYLGITVFGLIVWYYTKSAAYALLITISISLLGGTLTVQKAYDGPGTETLSTWWLALVSSVLAALSVGRWDWVLLAYPLYLLTLNTAIVCAILMARARKLRPAVFANSGEAMPIPVETETPLHLTGGR